MTRRQREPLLKGTATHRRTEGDYMGVLLDTVTLDDWRDVVTATLSLAKAGDAPARAWLAQYLVGKPETHAPTPLTIVVQQLTGADPLINRLARGHLDPLLQDDDFEADNIKALIAAELAQKLPPQETAERPVTAGNSGESAP